MPGFFLGTVGGVIIDRFDRRKVMVLCDIGRASLLVLLPFVEQPAGLVLISLGLEILTLLWGPAQAARCRTSCAEEQLSSANSLSLAASLRHVPDRVDHLLACSPASRPCSASFDIISSFKVDQEVLALVFDAMTFLVSAVDRLPAADPAPRQAPKGDSASTGPRPSARSRKGLQFIAQQPLVRGVMLGLGFGLIGAGRDDPARSERSPRRC